MTTPLEQRIAELEASLEHTCYWYACRSERLWHWAHERLSEDLKNEYFHIVANGTASVNEPPTYAQQMNMLKHRAEKAEDENARLLAEVARLQHHADAKTSSHNAPVGPCELSEQFRDLVTTGLSITRIAPSDFLAATSEWIGVKDRLPNDETPVLVFTRDSGIYEASIEWERPTFEETYEPFRYWSDRDNRYEFEWDDITHWMPLPPPPHSHGQAVEDAPPVPGV